MKRAIIFGSTGGIGQQITRSMAKQGWSLYLHYANHPEIVDQLLQELEKDYPKQDFFSFQFDFNKPIDLNFFADFFTINALIFSQGITDYHLLAEQSNDVIDNLVNINLTVPLKLIKYFEPQLIKQPHSRIIMLGSVYGANGSPMETVYSAVKGAISSFANAYAKEVASTNLTVNVIAPGAVLTPMTKVFSPSELAEVESEIPVGRLATPVDISYWVRVLLQKEADYLTGQTIYVDGGWRV